MSGIQQWKAETWRLAPRLDTPELAPCALQCAIVSQDPLELFRESFGRVRTRPLPETPPGQEAVVRSALREGAWTRIFAKVTGDRVFLLTDFARAAQDGTCSMRPFMMVSSDEPEGRKWLVSKVLHTAGGDLCWCVSFDARIGREVSIALTRANALVLDSIPVA